MEGIAEKPVIYFDGTCRLCRGSVRFIARRDPRKHFLFSPLQSPAGRALTERLGMDQDAAGSIILAEGPHAYTRSEAALRIASRLSAPWPLLRVLRVVPRPLRDALYNWIARNRYRWFGQADIASLPDDEWRDRFVDSSEDGNS